MANLQPLFDKVSVGSITSNSTDIWIDILNNAPDYNSPIPSGQQIHIGYITCISSDKTASFELRPNKPGESTGTTTTTNLRGFVNVTGGESQDLDVYYNGVIASFAPVGASSTGVEKLWLRIKCGSSSAATYEYIIYYTLY